MGKEFNNVSKLFNYLNQCSNDFYFRGYSNENQLKPRLGMDDGFNQNEVLMLIELAETKEISDLKINSIKRLLEFAQHYGIPTRFIDWSINPFVALFFAIGENIFEKRTIFIGCLSKNDPDLFDVKDIPELPFIIEDYEDTTIFDLVNKTSISQITSFKLFTKHSDFLDYIKKPFVIRKYFEYITKIESFCFHSYEKDIVNLRKEAQNGVFSFHRNVKKVFPYERFENITIHLNIFQKIEVKYRLMRKGITSKFLLPSNGPYKKIIRNCQSIKKKYKTSN